MLRTTRTLLALTLAAIAPALAACGGGSSSSVTDTLNKAFSTPLKSANVNLDVQLSLNGVKQLQGPVKLNLQGPYESGGKSVSPGE